MKRRKSERAAVLALQARYKVPNTDLSVAEYADLTGFAESEVRQAIRDGRIPHRKVGKRLWIPPTPEVIAHIRLCLSDVDEHIENAWRKHPPIKGAEP